MKQTRNMAAQCTHCSYTPAATGTDDGVLVNI